MPAASSGGSRPLGQSTHGGLHEVRIMGIRLPETLRSKYIPSDVVSIPSVYVQKERF
jgi:hypothetical protein